MDLEGRDAIEMKILRTYNAYNTFNPNPDPGRV